jgi:acyl carrier protein
MMLDQIPEIVRRTFKSEIGDIDIDDDLDLLESGIIDSLGLSRLAMALEGAFPGLRVPDSDVTPENLGSSAKTKAYIAQRLAQG